MQIKKDGTLFQVKRMSNTSIAVLCCLKSRNWRTEYLNKKLQNVNKEKASIKILGCGNEVQVRDSGKYLKKVAYKWFDKQKKIKYVSEYQMAKVYYHDNPVLIGRWPPAWEEMNSNY
jgi:predicted nuclease of restriction endonuclease-like RecB superfamily